MAFSTLTKEKAADDASVLSTKSDWQLTKSEWQFLSVFGLVFGAACLLIFNNLGNFPLFNPDEALYAEPAREMLETGEYITTLLNYAVRFTKPPLVIWAMAANYQLFGVTEFAARYFGAACGAILVAATYLFARVHLNGRAALIAAFSLMTAPLFISTAREAITDMPLSLFVAGSLMCFYHSYATRSSSAKGHESNQLPDSSGIVGNATRWLCLAYALVGLAVMTKGPIGIILPVAIIGVFHLLRLNVKSALLFYKPWFGILLVALIAVPWFAVEISVTKGAYYNEFILRENFQRFTAVVDHKAAWWYHIAAMLGGFFPWSVFLPGALVAALFARTAGSNKILTRFQNLTPRQSLMLFAACASLIILVFFSAGVSKLIPYTLPAFPMLALLTAGYIDELWTERAWKPLAIVFALLTAVYAGALLAVPVLGAKLHDCPPALLSAINALLVVHVIAALTSTILSIKQKYAAALTSFCVATFVALLFIGNQGLEAVSDQWERPIRSFAQFAAGSKDPILVYQMRKPSVTFYAKRKFLLPKNPKELTYILSKTDRAYIISRSRSEKELKAIPGSKHLCQMGEYVLTAYRRPAAAKSSVNASPAANAPATLIDREMESND